MKILAKFPSRARPHIFRSTLDKYYQKASGKHQIEFLISIDLDDNSMVNQDMAWWLGKDNGEHNRQDLIKINPQYGNSKTKVQAINADMDKVLEKDWEILILISDDMTCQIQGYDDIVVNDMNKYSNNDMFALHYHDGRVGQSLNSLSIMNRKMYDYFGYIYNPQFRSLWCDNYFQETTERMGKVKFLNQTIIKHDWTSKTGKDKLHRRNESYYSEDEQTFKRLKALGFPK